MNQLCCKAALTDTFRDLWTQHVMWTRSFIISTAASLDDLKYVTERLMRNPADFAKILCNYYGSKKAQKFQQLLTEHLSIAGALVGALKAGNTDLANTERKKWYANAEEIAEYLACINPYWSKEKWKCLLDEHLKMTEEEAVYRLNGNYEKDIAKYDLISCQALAMGDYMAEGIIRQFS